MVETFGLQSNSFVGFGAYEWCALKNALHFGFCGPGKGKERLKRVETLYVDVQHFAAVLLPLDSADFHPDGNSQGKRLENSGKQNPKMGFKWLVQPA